MINVLLADDHTMFVDGIDSILKTESDIAVVGKVYNGPDVVRSRLYSKKYRPRRTVESIAHRRRWKIVLQ